MATTHRPRTQSSSRPAWAFVIAWLMLQSLRLRAAIPVAARVATWMLGRLTFLEHLASRRVPGARERFVRSLLATVRTKLARRELSAAMVARWVGLLLTAAVWGPRRAERFRRTHGFAPPSFLVVSPTDACNLRCQHCYAHAGVARPGLSWEMLTWLTEEQWRCFGASLVVISGGEPLLYRDAEHARSILDFAEAHGRTLFIVYSNGFFIDATVAARAARLGNVLFLLSLEGSAEETARIRGPEAHGAVMRAAAALRAHGVLFGLSLTVSSVNADELVQASFYEHAREAVGASFFWLLERATVGRGAATPAACLSPAQRLRVQAALQALIRRHGFLIVSFLHVASASSGCMGAGRVDAFVHVDAGGVIRHCVYCPMPLANALALRANGEPLAACLTSALAARIRSAQNEYFASARGAAVCRGTCPVIALMQARDVAGTGACATGPIVKEAV